MDKYLFPLFILILSLPAMATCPNKINPKKVMLFVDTNLGDMEIAAAQKAACKRGERLEVIPKNWKEYTKHQAPVVAALAVYRACEDKNKNSDQPFGARKTDSPCEPLFEKYREANKKMSAFRGSQAQIYDQVKTRLEELKKENVKLTNVSLSGHDGGGHFGGDKGDISRRDIDKLMKEFPELNAVESLLLLGCYTGVQSEVSAWKGTFPNVKLIGGYDGSAPLSHRIQGHNYITNILNKEKALLALKNKSNIDQDIKRLINNLGELNAAVYVDLACKEEDDEFYYASKLDRKFNKLNISECEKSRAEMEKIRPYYNQLYSGEVEPPTVTSSGESRNLYDKVRTHDHCSDNNGMLFGSSEMNSNGAFNLLFWHGVKQNFGNFYDPEMKEVEEILKGLTEEDFSKEILAAIKLAEEDKKSVLADIELFEKDPDAFKAKVQADRDELKKKSEDAKKDPKYVEIMNRINNGSPINHDDMAIVNKVGAINFDIYKKEMELQDLQSSPAQFIESKKSRISYIDSTITAQSLQLAQVKEKTEKIKKLWMPTKENMNVKTRKEVMDNIHALNGVLMDGSLPPKVQGALSFVNAVSTNHLQYFRNPFSWHEFTGTTGAPEHVMKLSSFLSSNAMMSPASYGSGYGYGGMSGGSYGGMVGGSQSGAGGGTGGEGGGMQDRPIH